VPGALVLAAGVPQRLERGRARLERTEAALDLHVDARAGASGIDRVVLPRQAQVQRPDARVVAEEGIVAIARTTHSAPERERKAGLLLQYIQSEDFGLHMGLIAGAIEDLRSEQGREKATHQTMWERRETRFEAIVAASAKVQTRIQAIVEQPHVALVPAAVAT